MGKRVSIEVAEGAKKMCFAPSAICLSGLIRKNGKIKNRDNSYFREN